MAIVWVIRMDCCSREVVAVASSNKAAVAHMECRGRQCNFKHTYSAEPMHLITETEANGALERLDAKDAALAKLTDDDREALGL